MHWYITALTDYILLFHSFFHTCRYLNAIQTTCPHILRYLTTAVITNKRRRTVLKDLVKVIQQESYTYKDPITEFLECLYVNFDFDGAQQKLRECETVSFLVTFVALCFTFWVFCALFSSFWIQWSLIHVAPWQWEIFSSLCVTSPATGSYRSQLYSVANTSHSFPQLISWQHVYAVVQFYPRFRFYFPLVWGMVMYDNEFKTKGNMI